MLAREKAVMVDERYILSNALNTLEPFKATLQLNRQLLNVPQLRSTSRTYARPTCHAALASLPVDPRSCM